MSDLSLTQHLRDLTKGAQERLIKDINAIGAADVNTCPGGVARPALSLVVECGAVNGMVAAWLSTGVDPVRPPKEERDAFMASFTTTESAVAFLEQETAKLYQAFDSLDAATLGEVSDVPLGRPMSKLAVAELPAFHMMYHDGQLNYIQCLHGDGEIHW